MKRKMNATELFTLRNSWMLTFSKFFFKTEFVNEVCLYLLLTKMNMLRHFLHPIYVNIIFSTWKGNRLCLLYSLGLSVSSIWDKKSVFLLGWWNLPVGHKVETLHLLKK